MSVNELIAQAKEGDHNAFASLMKAHEGGVRSICGRFAKNPDDAEDLVLDTFVEAYLNLRQLRRPESFGWWLRTIAINICRTWYRQKKTEPVPVSAEPSDPETEVYLDDRLVLGIDRLSEAHRHILHLHYQAGLSYQEIADELGVPIGTVMSRMHRARNALKDIVEADEENLMDEHPELEQRFRMEIELLEALEAEVETVGDIRKVKGHSPPMIRLRQVLETHPPRLVDLLRVADSDERLNHLAWLARFAMIPIVPVMASCALSDDEVLRDRATRMAEHWVVRLWYELSAINLFLDALISSPAGADRKAHLLVRLLQVYKETIPDRAVLGGSGGPYVMFEIMGVLLAYPNEAFPVLWEALWRLDEDDEVENGVRATIGHLTIPMVDALIDEVRSGKTDRIARMLREMRLVRFGGVEDLPERVNPVLVELVGSEEPIIASRAREACVSLRLPVIAPFLRQQIASGTSKARADALQALTYVISDDAIPDLIAHVKDPEARVRAEALNGLSRQAVVSAKDAILERLETDEDASVREAAIKAYGKVASDSERNACLRRITKSGDRRAMRVAAKALYVGTGPRQLTELEEQRIQRIRGDARPKGYPIEPFKSLRALPEIRPYGEEELTKIIATVCTDYSTTRRNMVMEGRHALMRREKGIYTFTQIGEAVWRVGQFMEDAKEERLQQTESR